jgi:hypothetical protein
VVLVCESSRGELQGRDGESACTALVVALVQSVDLVVALDFVVVLVGCSDGMHGEWEGKLGVGFAGGALV